VPTLDTATRARVTARIQLTRALRAVPPGVAAAVRDRHAVRPGRLSSRAVGVLRHRSISSLGSFALADNGAGCWRPGTRRGSSARPASSRSAGRPCPRRT